MKSSVLYGGDLHSALDWLCLNLRDGKIYSTNPDGIVMTCNVVPRVTDYGLIVLRPFC